ncbi:MAG: hypothetical protein GTN62_14665 [Gemmatimonadales bacterium]|nr:hypothetical protein [Gemmatimonadales bacterium]NIN51330.1 hypothetical protein [Gemmatimonadales bacterium]NIP08794.1 hypothetical protein [Gemmatimonadales bacterium]NIQ99788.1 hypothetical protein [Gemmatimonadales bacterium]
MRIDFAGGWTDVRDFADREEGVVVNGAITLHVHVDFLLGQRGIKLHAEDLREHVTIPSSREIRYDGQLDLHKAALNMLPVTGGIEILSRSEAPSGSGLGASGALDVALLGGLSHCRAESYSREELAELGFQLETAELSLLGGKQDQYAAALGGFHELTFNGDTVHTRRLSVEEDAARDLEAHLVLAYTGHSHFSSDTHARVWAAYGEGKPAVTQALRTIRDLTRPAAAALEAGAWQRLAEVIHENWRQQQRLDATISTPRIAGIERAAKDAGAWGLKATGAGAGGCMAILCPSDKRPGVVNAVTAAGGQVLEAGFASEGVAVWEQEDAPGNA